MIINLQIFIYAIIVGIASVCISLLHNKKLGLILPITIMGSALSVYLFGILFNNLLIGIIFWIVIEIILLVIIFYKKVEIFNSFKLLCLNASVVFFLCCLMCLLFSSINGDIPYKGDEFSHWGPMVKEMVRTNSLYINEETITIGHRDYPPIIQIIEYSACVLSGGYSYTCACNALGLFQLSLFLILIPERKNTDFSINKSYKTMVGSLCIFVLIIIFSLLFVNCGDEFSSPSFGSGLYVDSALGLTFGFTLFLIIYKDKTTLDGMFVIISSCFLTLIKQSSLFFALVVVILLLLYIFINVIKTNNNKTQILRNNVMSVFTIISVIFIYQSWKIKYENSYVSNVDEEQFKISLTNVNQYFDTLFNGSNERIVNVFNDYTNALFYRNIFFNDFNICISFVVLSIILLIIIIGLYYFYKKSSIQQYSFLLLSISFITVIIGYSFFMLFSYMFLFDESEANTVCYCRYIITCIIPFYYIIFILLIKYFLKKDNVYKWFSCVLVVSIFTILIFNNYVKENFMPNIYKDDHTNRIINTKKQCDYINIKAIENSEVLVLSHSYEDTEIWPYRAEYFCNGLNINFASSGITNNIITKSYENNLGIFNRFDYVYTYFDEGLNIDALNKFFKTNLQTNNVYKVDKENRTLNKI